MKSLIKIKHDKITNHYKFLKEVPFGLFSSAGGPPGFASKSFVKIMMKL